MELSTYTGPWDDDDPDANFKAAVAEYTRIDPLPTFAQLSANTGIPIGALVRYALVRWAAEGSEALLALGPLGRPPHQRIADQRADRDAGVRRQLRERR